MLSWQFSALIIRDIYSDSILLLSQVATQLKQESPAIADKPARHESLPKLLQFDVLTTLSLTILAYLHAFNCYCVRNPRNPEKFKLTEFKVIQGHRYWCQSKAHM